MYAYLIKTKGIVKPKTIIWDLGVIESGEW
jgi:hypothetical protein